MKDFKKGDRVRILPWELWKHQPLVSSSDRKWSDRKAVITHVKDNCSAGWGKYRIDIDPTDTIIWETTDFILDNDVTDMIHNVLRGIMI